MQAKRTRGSNHKSSKKDRKDEQKNVNSNHSDSVVSRKCTAVNKEMKSKTRHGSSKSSTRCETPSKRSRTTVVSDKRESETDTETLDYDESGTEVITFNKDQDTVQIEVHKDSGEFQSDEEQDSEYDGEITSDADPNDSEMETEEPSMSPQSSQEGYCHNDLRVW